MDFFVVVARPFSIALLGVEKNRILGRTTARGGSLGAQIDRV